MKSLMHGMALESMKLMPECDRQLCVRFMMKQLMKNGCITEDDSRAVIDYDLKRMEELNESNNNG